MRALIPFGLLLVACGTSKTCTPANCPGCCVDTVCHPGNELAGCGIKGNACQACTSDEMCTDQGVCVRPFMCGPANCATCCAANACQIPTSDSACGSGGVACSSCGTGQWCDGGLCNGQLQSGEVVIAYAVIANQYAESLFDLTVRVVAPTDGGTVADAGIPLGQPTTLFTQQRIADFAEANSATFLLPVGADVAFGINATSLGQVHSFNGSIQLTQEKPVLLLAYDFDSATGSFRVRYSAVQHP